MQEHFPYVYEGGHWIRDNDDGPSILSICLKAASIGGLILILGWLFFCVFFLI